MLTPEQRAAVLECIEAGGSITAAARQLGIRRPAIYEDADRDPAFAAQLAEARAGRRRSNEPPSDPGEMTAYDSETPLSGHQIGAFVRELHASGSVQKAALAACVDLHPRRLDPKQIPREARDHLRTALRIVAESRRAPGPTAEQEALAGWLRSERWPDDPLDVQALRKLSPRAADDYEATMRGRAVVNARNSRKAKRDTAGEWEAF